MQWQLAEVNLAWMRYPLEDQRMLTMRDEIVRINRLRDQSPGFIWRYETAQGDATDVRVLDDPRVLFNLSIWRSVKDLRAYVYHGEHVAFFRQWREWFRPPPQDPVAMWWVKEGASPTVDDAMARWRRLRSSGPTILKGSRFVQPRIPSQWSDRLAGAGCGSSEISAQPPCSHRACSHER